MFSRIGSTLIAGLICAGGGFLFNLIHAPLPWMLGSLTAAALTAILGGSWFIPALFRGPARPVVGVLTGSAFTASTLASMVTWWDAILLVIGQTVLMTLLGFIYFQRVARFDRETAFFSAAPGGVGEMTLLAGSLGGDVRAIVTAHLMRIMVVLFAVPFIAQIIVGHPIGRLMPNEGHVAPELGDWLLLALCGVGGYALGRVIRIPGGLMIFPMILSAAVHSAGLTEASPPAWLVAFVQIVIGGVVGARFAGIHWRTMRRTIICSVGWAVAILTTTVASALLGSWLVGQSFLAMMLALAPGGTVEMVILTFSVGFEVAFVVTCQLARILFVLLITPGLFSLFSRNTANRSGGTARPDRSPEVDRDLD